MLFICKCEDLLRVRKSNTSSAQPRPADTPPARRRLPRRGPFCPAHVAHSPVGRSKGPMHNEFEFPTHRPEQTEQRKSPAPQLVIKHSTTLPWSDSEDVKYCPLGGQYGDVGWFALQTAITMLNLSAISVNVFFMIICGVSYWKNCSWNFLKKKR